MFALVEVLTAGLVASSFFASTIASDAVVGPLVTSLILTIRCVFAFSFFIVGPSVLLLSSSLTDEPIKMLPVSCTLFLVASTDA